MLVDQARQFVIPTEINSSVFPVLFRTVITLVLIIYALVPIIRLIQFLGLRI